MDKKHHLFVLFFVPACLLGQTQTSVSLISSAPSSTLGQIVTFSASVTPAGATGKVTFYDGTSIAGLAQLSNGSATFKDGLLHSGVHVMQAVYSGDNNFAGSSSATLSQKVTSVEEYGLLAPTSYATPDFPLGFATADFNGDGKVDFIVGIGLNLVPTNMITCLLNNGDGTFSSITTTLATNIDPNYLAVGDFNGDGKTDVALVTGTQTISVLPGKGDGTFGSAVTTNLGETFSSIIVGDFNHDGNLDLAGLGQGTVLIFLGNGDGTFNTGGSYGPISNDVSLSSGDFNGDGYADLVVGVSGGVAVLLGVGDGSFNTPVIFGAYSGSFVAVADFNGDGRADIGTVDNLTGIISTLLGNGDGTFQGFVSSQMGVVVWSMAIGDFNGDGLPDLAVSGEGTSSVAVAIGNGDGTFGTPTFFGPVNTSAGTLVAGDFNQDGRVDVAFSFPGIIVFLGNSSDTNCATVNPSSLAVDSTPSSYYFTVTATSQPCNWAMSTNSAWIGSTSSLTTNGGSLVANLGQNTTGSVRTGTITINGSTIQITQDATQQVFTDVPPSNPFFDEVNQFSTLGITSGCAPSEFCPTEDVTRDQMAIFLVRTVYNGSDNFSYSATPYFSDVPATYWAFKWIQKLWELGITGGCSAGLYCPTEAVSRAQMAVFIIRARYGGTAVFDWNPVPYFSDVPATAFGFQWIQRMAMDAITTGCTATTYCPNDPVTREEMAVFIMRGGFNQFLPPQEPILTQVSPYVLLTGTTSTFNVTGSNTHFAQGATTITVGPGVTVGPIAVSNSTSFAVQLTAATSAPLQPTSILAITPTAIGNEEAVMPNGVSVLNVYPPPVITAFTYTELPGGEGWVIYNFTFTGSYFLPGSQLVVCTPATYNIPQYCVPYPSTVVSSSELTANPVWLDPNEYELYIQSSSGQSNEEPFWTF